MYREVVAEGLSRPQFDAARLGFFGVLRRKRMSPQFIERHGEDLFAQACFEYSRRLAEGEPIRDPAAWIVTCGWNRTKNLLESRDWLPSMVSTERLGELREDDASPEQEFLAEDRHRKVRNAVERLPDHQRRLLALSYFEGESVREAGRRLGWTSSRAQRAHETARRRLHKMLGVEWSDELGFEVGIAAFLSVAGGGCSWHLRAIGGVEGALDALAHPAEIGHRVIEVVGSPFAHGGPTGRPGTDVGLHAVVGRLHQHPALLIGRVGRRISDLGRRAATSGVAEGGAAAAEGGGRTLELCKAVAAVCVIGGGAVTGALIAEGHHGDGRPARHGRTVAATSRPHRNDAAGLLLAQGQVAEQVQGTPSAEGSSAAPAPHPVERHRSPERQRSEPEVKKAKPPPERPEGEFEPSPEATTSEPEATAEADTEVVEEAKTTTSTSSSGASAARPKAVPANSPGEFEP